MNPATRSRLEQYYKEKMAIDHDTSVARAEKLYFMAGAEALERILREAAPEFDEKAAYEAAAEDGRPDSFANGALWQHQQLASKIGWLTYNRDHAMANEKIAMEQIEQLRAELAETVKRRDILWQEKEDAIIQRDDARAELASAESAGLRMASDIIKLRADCRAMAEALGRVHKLSLLGSNAVSIEASRMCCEALTKERVERYLK